MAVSNSTPVLICKNCLTDSVNVEVITIIAVVVAVLSSVIVLLSIAVNVVRLISLTILVPPGNPRVSHQSNESNKNIDEVVDKTTARE